MEMVKKFEPLALLLLVVGALNWGIIGVFETNVLADIFGTGTFLDVLYTVVGVAALVYIPKMMEALHIPGPHPRGV